jgi:hypothetical protein
MEHSPREAFHVTVCNDCDSFLNVFRDLHKNNNTSLSFYVIAKTSNDRVIDEFEKIVRRDKKYVIYSNKFWHYITLLNKITYASFKRIFKHYFFPNIHYFVKPTSNDFSKPLENKRSNEIDYYSPNKKLKTSTTSTTSSYSTSPTTLTSFSPSMLSSSSNPSYMPRNVKSNMETDKDNKLVTTINKPDESVKIKTPNNKFEETKQYINSLNKTNVIKVETPKKEFTKIQSPRYFEKSNEECAKMFMDAYNGKILDVVDDQDVSVFNKSTKIIEKKTILNIDTQFIEDGEIVENKKSSSRHEKMDTVVINQILQTKQNKAALSVINKQNIEKDNAQ